MNTRAAILAMAVTAGFSSTAALAQQGVPPPFQSPFGTALHPQEPMDGPQNGGGFVRESRTPQDRAFRGEDGLLGAIGRPGWIFEDGGESNRPGLVDDFSPVQPVEPWVPPSARERRGHPIGDDRSMRPGGRGPLLPANQDEAVATASTFQNENRRSPESSSSSGSWEDRVRFRIGVSHLTPKVEMRCDLRGGALGLSVSALGDVRVDLAPSRDGRGMFQAAINPVGGRYDVGYRVRF